MLKGVIRCLNPSMIRGPKKKGGAKKEEGPLSSDVVNIWKEREDCSISLNDRDYPLWLIQLSKQTAPLDSYLKSWMCNGPVLTPNLNDFITLKN